jgi:hypothetical protein
VTTSAVASVAENVACPFWLVTALAGVVVVAEDVACPVWPVKAPAGAVAGVPFNFELPFNALRVMVLPAIGLEKKSVRVTVTVVGVVPSAGGLEGFAVTVVPFADGSAGPGVKVIDAVWLNTKLPSDVSVAVKVTNSACVSSA